ncbi:DUF6691 family protein [Aquibaculum arenosum]|uniref:YeeE/YedE family protein n=1 Tax=Aquibaculum arenosum TaxID=3032591 RepID=A0ABT5YMP1_9PROT|nr:DUF6691 family protein [Fodinicurvata sp. CAU 1616]MDF2096227.1 YeeE/YedE family protein [Fodinicurvata sp. CAU 1616]
MLFPLVGLLAGLLFGIGLTISQMVNPEKVVAFLDFGGIATGTWDPSLGLVMGAALLFAAPGFYIARRREAPILGDRFDTPQRRNLDGRLIGGALLFGAGWGLVGYCPGPAIAGLAFGRMETVIFVAFMLLGMLAYRRLTAPGHDIAYGQ